MMSDNNLDFSSNDEFDDEVKLEIDENMWNDFDKFQVHILRWSNELPTLKVTCVFKGDASNKNLFLKKHNFNNETLILVEKSTGRLIVTFSELCKYNITPELIQFLDLYIKTRAKMRNRLNSFSTN